MHMADALISPQVGAVMWGATAVTAAYCARKVRDEADERTVPLMGVAGAFVFAAQMLNFSIPGTGSSGHLGGGLILAVLLGPHAAFLVMTSILGVQALFFGDGGLLALGANIFNLGFFPAFVAFPLVWRTIVGDRPGPGRILAGGITGALTGLLLGALGVVVQTAASGVSELPLLTFAGVMLPIHLAIGLVEGLVTAGVVLFVFKAQPELLSAAADRGPAAHRTRRVVVGLLVAALLSGGVFAWFASSDPDGLEWSIARVTGAPEVDGESGSAIHESLADAQENTAFLPDYALPTDGPSGAEPAGAKDAGPVAYGETSLAGIVGVVLVLGIAALTGFVLKRRAPAADRV